MRDQSALDFRGTQPKSVNLEEIVGTSGIPKIALFILIVFVAGAEPVADKSFLRFFVFVPVARAGGVSLNQEIANFVGSDGVSVFVDDCGFVTWDKFSARTRPCFAGAIGDDHLQSLCRTERIKNFDAKALFES